MSLKGLHVPLLRTSPSAFIQATLSLQLITVYIKTMRSLIRLLIAGREGTDKLHSSVSIPATIYLVNVANSYHLSDELYILQTDG